MPTCHAASRALDFHAHIFPAKVAAKAVESIARFYEAPVAHSGCSIDLLESGARAGFRRYVVHSTATRADQVEAINDFLIGECRAHPEFIGFGTMHPAHRAIEAELARAKAAGLRGIKLHPDFQCFRADDPAAFPVYAAARDLGMPVLIHAGDARYDYSGPARLRRALDAFPGITMIAAHFGGYTEWEAAVEHLVGRDIYFDTSSTLWKIEPAMARSIIKGHGIERMLFGSDYPMWDHAEELARLEALGLGDDAMEALLWRNGARLLGL